MKTTFGKVALALTLAALVAALLVPALAQAPAEAAAPASLSEAYRQVFEKSMKEKKGITLYVGGQIVGGAVTRIIGDDAVELRNQEYSRIVVRVEEIEAIALH